MSTYPTSPNARLYWNPVCGQGYETCTWNLRVHTSPRCESPHWPLVSGLAMMTLTPGRSFPDSMRQRECGLPLSTKDTRSLRKARRSTYTVDGSGLDAPCRTINRFEVSFRYKVSLECGSINVSLSSLSCLCTCGKRTMQLTNSIDSEWHKRITKEVWTTLVLSHTTATTIKILTVSP
jgi:hypothetical protein